MKTASFIALVLAIHGTGCAGKPRAETGALPPPTGSLRTPDQAIAVVQRHIRDTGGDPERQEISARWRRNQWLVTSWRIVYPNNKDASRFVPDGFTTYTVSADGHITDMSPGR